MKNDIELINEIKSNNDDASFNELLSKYELMIHKLANSYKAFYGDYAIDANDLFQEGTLALYEACFKYEESANTKFSTFAFSFIRNRILSKAKKYLRLYAKEFYSYSKIENPEYLASTGYVSQTKGVVSEPALYMLNKFMETVSDEDAQILEYRIKGLEYKEIAKKMEITTKKIDNRLYRMRKEFSVFKLNKNSNDDN